MVLEVNSQHCMLFIIVLCYLFVIGLLAHLYSTYTVCMRSDVCAKFRLFFFLAHFFRHHLIISFFFFFKQSCWLARRRKWWGGIGTVKGVGGIEKKDWDWWRRKKKEAPLLVFQRWFHRRKKVDTCTYFILLCVNKCYYALNNNASSFEVYADCGERYMLDRAIVYLFEARYDQ